MQELGLAHELLQWWRIKLEAIAKMEDLSSSVD